MRSSLATALLLAGCLALRAPAAHAQATFSIGPRVGLNLATFHFGESQPGTVGFRAGFEAGLVGSAGFGHFALQPALLYSQKGHTFRTPVDVRTANNLPFSSGELLQKDRLNYLTLPLNVAYRQHPDGQGFQVVAGPYLGLLLSGSYEVTITANGSPVATDSGRITPVANDAPVFGACARRFDAGLQGGLGYRYQAWLLELDYSLGLRDVAARHHDNGVPVGLASYYNRVFQVSLAYLLGPKG